jgi:cysteine desulfurase
MRVYFLGEPPLGFHLGINGLLTPESELFYSGTDRAPVHAIADTRQSAGLKVSQHIQVSGKSSDLAIYQPVNPETGVLSPAPESFLGGLFVDNTAYGVSAPLPDNWMSAMWQSRSWRGPSGLAILAIRNGAQWRNPLPHNDSQKVPQAFSIPLALASAVALENFAGEYLEAKSRTSHFKKVLIDFLHTEIGDVVVAGEKSQTSPFLLSASIAGIDSERLINDLNTRSIYIDSGSACISANMQPSHVLAAMGLPTTGNIRLTFHTDTQEEAIDHLLTNLKECVIRQRTIQ